MTQLTRRQMLVGTAAAAFAAAVPFAAPGPAGASAPAAGRQAPGFYRYKVGSTEVTRAQLRYLAEMGAGCPEVSIRILPFAAGEHAGSSAGFSILQFGQLPSLGLVHVDGPTGGICLDTPAAIAACTTTFTHLQLACLTRQESAARITEASRANGA